MKRLVSIFLLLAIAPMMAFSVENVIRFRLTNMDNGLSDETIIRFNDDGTEAVDQGYDISKIFYNNPANPRLYTQVEGEAPLYVNTYPPLNRRYTIDLFATSEVPGTFLMETEVLGIFDSQVEVFVDDLLSKTLYDITAEFPMAFFMSDTPEPKARFQVIFYVPVLSQHNPFLDEDPINRIEDEGLCMVSASDVEFPAPSHEFFKREETPALKVDERANLS